MKESNDAMRQRKSTNLLVEGIANILTKYTVPAVHESPWIDFFVFKDLETLNLDSGTNNTNTNIFIKSSQMGFSDSIYNNINLKGDPNYL